MDKKKTQVGAEHETEKKKYPIGPEHYSLFEEVGQGVSACVRRALCKPFDEIVAIKILDFERDNCDLNNVYREAQTMVLVDHPNVLKSHCSFVSGHTLWVVMPFMAGGSCLHILKAAHPDGFGEAVIATILREILKGLEYLHHHGHIHRDVKAGNILIDSRGAIKLGDFGVSACLFDSGDRQRVRNTFVGTPCWMAPEVMEQLHGYDFKADIWSFGITALELAHGHAPFSRYPPMKVLLMTLQQAPPGLDYERDRKFSRSFKQMIASCLVKDPSQRPSAKKLLKHSFFKHARSNDYIARTLLEGLPDLGDRIKELKRKEEDMLAQKKIPDGQKEEMSQNEYKRGISGWCFDLDFLKDQASLIQDIDETVSDSSQTGSSSSLSALDVNEKQLKCPNLPDIADTENNCMNQSQSATFLSVESTSYDYKRDKSDDESTVASSSHEQHISQHYSPLHDNRVENNLDEKPDLEKSGRNLEALDMHSQDRSQGSLDHADLPGSVNLQIKEESEKLQGRSQNGSNCNAAVVQHPVDDVAFDVSSRLSKSPDGEEIDEKAKEPVVQQKGRFKVTSENVDVEKVVSTPTLQKSQSLQVIALHQQVPSPSPFPSPQPSFPPSPSNIAASSALYGGSLFSLLNTILETNIVQRDVILSIMKQVAASDFTANGRCMSSGVMERTMLEEALEREKRLLHEITDLSGRLLGTQDEQQKNKTENVEVNT